MKKKSFSWCFVIFLMCSQGFAQEWMTSLSVAQSLALVQNKMLLVMWEDATTYPYPLRIQGDNGKVMITDLFEEQTQDVISKIIWDHFVPVVLYESQHENLLKEIKGKRSTKYIDKFNDDGIKIMDANGYILNIDEPFAEILDLNDFIDRYALNMAFLQSQLRTYRDNKNYVTALRLGLRYYDFAVFNNKKHRADIVNLGNIYLNEAKKFLSNNNQNENQELLQRLALNELKQYLILNKPKKALRQLKKLEIDNLHESNISIHAFLNYGAYKMLDKDKEAEIWKTQVSSVDLKKVQLIINSNN